MSWRKTRKNRRASGPEGESVPRQVVRRCRRALAPLHRRLFLWFGVAIVLAGSVGFAVQVVIAGGPGGWRRDFEAIKGFGERRFAETWDVPERRLRLARELGDSLDADVTLRGSDGSELDRIGEGCERPTFRLEPSREGVRLGSVSLCRRRSAGRPLSAFLGLFAGLGVLWLVSHKVARRIGRPILELSRAAVEIGKGNHDVSVQVGRRPPIEIARLAESVRDMAAKIKQQLHDQRELLASVSHEIRSPLARVRLLLELLQGDHRSPADREKLVRDLEQEIEEMDELVGGLLASSRLDFSALVRRPNDLVAALERATERAGLDLEVEVQGDAEPVGCDATLLARALGNVLDNAKSHAGGARKVSIAFDDQRATIEITDDGPGFTEGDEERVFDPFFRGQGRGAQGPKGHESLGLGLSLVRRIARAHGGDAFARNEQPSGATVCLWLPLDRGEDAEEPAASS